MKKLYIYIIVFMVNTIIVYSQDIVTASNYFDEVSNRYSNIKDYIADISVRNINEESSSTMNGTMYYSKPNKVLIQFTSPRGQILVSNGEHLKVYMPSRNTILSQSLGENQDTNSLATSEGLSLLKSKYSIAYTDDGPNFVLLNGNSGPRVKKLILLRRSSQEGFRQITLSVLENNLITRIEGITADSKRVVFDFANIRTNQGISLSIFEDAINSFPPNANEFVDFLH